MQKRKTLNHNVIDINIQVHLYLEIIKTKITTPFGDIEIQYHLLHIINAEIILIIKHKLKLYFTSNNINYSLAFIHWYFSEGSFRLCEWAR